MLKNSLYFRKAGVKQRTAHFCKHLELWSEEYYKCIALNYGFTAYHPVGTCKMGSEKDPMTVVDNHLKVINIAKLRIIDASIMPRVIGGNTNAPSIMIGERGADFLLKDYGQGSFKHRNKDEL